MTEVNVILERHELSYFAEYHVHTLSILHSVIAPSPNGESG